MSKKEFEMFKIVLISLLSFGYIFANNAQTIVENVCSNCHGFWVHEGGLGVSLPPNSLPQKEILEKLRAYKTGTLSQYGMGMTMTEQLSNLSDKELVDLSHHIPTLKR